MSTMTAGERFLGDFVNYEAKGVPDRAGTDTDDGFDLVRNFLGISSSISSAVSSMCTWKGGSLALVCVDEVHCNLQGRMRRLLAALENPHEAWPVVHVAGTKGKGSTTALLAAMLKSAGYKVGSYTRCLLLCPLCLLFAAVPLHK